MLQLLGGRRERNPAAEQRICGRSHAQYTLHSPLFARRRLCSLCGILIFAKYYMLCFHIDRRDLLVYTVNQSHICRKEMRMHIGEMQKLTLLDYPGKVACTVFLSGCNLRCPFCHNPALVLPDCRTGGLSTEELLIFLKTRRGKLDGVCVTGGEPTLYKDLPVLLRQIRALGFAVKLDTNGTNPAVLEQLIHDSLLDYVAMDVKNSPERYAEACGGVELLGPVKRSAALLMAGTVDYEFRTTVCAPLHTPEEMTGIGRWLKGAKRYFLQPFVDSGALVGGGVSPLSEDEIKALRDSVLPYIPNTQIRGQ